MKGRVLKRIAIIVGIVVAVLVCVAAISLAMLQSRTDALHDNWASVFDDERFATPARVEGVEVITQDVSCGYAVIEMFSTWNGGNITEESLYDE